MRLAFISCDFAFNPLANHLSFPGRMLITLQHRERTGLARISAPTLHATLFPLFSLGQLFSPAL
jgi:hypothetical protein